MEREDFITTRYLLKIQGDAKYSNSVATAVKHCNYEQCRKAVSEAMLRVCHTGVIDLAPEERAFLQLTAWKQAGGSMNTHDSGFLLHQARVTGAHLNITDHHIAVKICPEYPQNQPNEIKENINMTKAFLTQHYVYGTLIDSMSEEALIAAIKKIEGQIADLKSIKTKSTKITANIAELNVALSNVVEALDAK